MENKEIHNLRLLAKCWNNLELSFINGLLANDIVYESQWVLTPIKGKEAVLAHLRAKYKAIHSSIISDQMTVKAEMAICPRLQNRHCIVLSQLSKGIERKVTMLISIKEDKINRIDVCFIPDPATVKPTGEVPK